MQKKMRKLRLSRETIRNLEENTLREVVAGVAGTANSKCHTHCLGCPSLVADTVCATVCKVCPA
jgi:hypothetical protein